MHPQLEKYLAEIEANLKGLTTEERELEILEITHHLKSIFAQHQAAGLSEDEAALITMQQFGTPRAIGREVVNATPGRQSSSLKGMTWGAAVGVLCALGFFAWMGPGPTFDSHPVPLSTLIKVAAYAACSGAIASRFGGRFVGRHFDCALGQGAIRGAVGAWVWLLIFAGNQLLVSPGGWKRIHEIPWIGHLAWIFIWALIVGLGNLGWETILKSTRSGRLQRA